MVGLAVNHRPLSPELGNLPSITQDMAGIIQPNMLDFHPFVNKTPPFLDGQLLAMN